MGNWGSELFSQWTLHAKGQTETTETQQIKKEKKDERVKRHCVSCFAYTNKEAVYSRQNTNTLCVLAAMYMCETSAGQTDGGSSRVQGPEAMQEYKLLL